MDIERLFTYHAPVSDQPTRYAGIRASAKAFARLIVSETPASAEQTLAIRALQQAVMWANAAIAVNEHASAPPDTPPVEVPAGAPSSPVSPEADRIAEQEVRADGEAVCARPGCGHARSRHGGIPRPTCIARVPEGTPGRVSIYCGCTEFTLDPHAEAVS